MKVTLEFIEVALRCKIILVGNKSMKKFLLSTTKVVTC